MLPQGLFCSPKMTPRKNKLAFFRALIDFVNFYQFFIKKRGSEASTFLKALCFEAVLPQGLFCSPKMTPRKNHHVFFWCCYDFIYFLLNFIDSQALKPLLGILNLESCSWDLGLGILGYNSGAQFWGAIYASHRSPVRLGEPLGGSWGNPRGRYK